MCVVTEGRVSSSRHSPAIWTAWLVAVTATSSTWLILDAWALDIWDLSGAQSVHARVATAEVTGPCGVETRSRLGGGP